MKLIKYIWLWLHVLLATPLIAQSIIGTIMDSKTRQPVIGATLSWAGSSKGAVTDVNGAFQIAYPAKTPAILVVSAIGYTTDSILLSNQREIHVMLKRNLELDEVEIVSKKESMSFSTIQTMNRQTLNANELKKAACCNLSESFETNATVDVSYANALTGAKQIKMLGLDGAYTQTMIDFQPGIRGLSNGAGWAHIPGTWVESIEITKGVGSVVYGYESMAGQINIELQKPEKNDRLFVNIYAGDIGRYEANIHTAQKINKHWSTILLTHASMLNGRNDFNRDGFLDMAIGNQISVYNKWNYDKPGALLASFGVFAGNEQRNGGQINYINRDAALPGINYYGVDVNNRFAEAFGKASIGFKGKPYKGVNFNAFARYYENTSMFGFKNYNGNQQTLNFTTTYQTIIGTSDHKIKAGASYLFDRFDEHYNPMHESSNHMHIHMERTELVPGIFTEYQYDDLKRFSVVAGFRADYHNMFGMYYTPRAHIKYSFTRNTALRLSGGTGFRTANVFIDQPAALASNRYVVVEGSLLPEQTQNYGISYTHKFKLINRNATWVSDYFYTSFINRIVADMERSANHIYFYNLQGQSYAHTIQSDFIYEPMKQIELRAAYKWQLPIISYAQNGNLLAPLVNQHRILFNAAYATRFDKWKFDATWKWFGPSRIPNNAYADSARQSGATSSFDNAFTSGTSPWFFTINAQITRKFKYFEVYAGGENLNNFFQQNQIILLDNQIRESSFDAFQLWGPVMGRVFYTGIRFSIK
jgi:outer membrane receptor for ferrienterochelin and colicins